MFDALTFVEVEGQHVEMLPARTVLSLIDLIDLGGGDAEPIGGDGGNNAAHNVKGTVSQHADGGAADAEGGDGVAANLLRGK